MYKLSVKQIAPPYLMFTILSLGMQTLYAADWPEWGDTPDRNMISNATNLPDDFALGGSNLDKTDMEDVLWASPLGSHTYGNPIVVGDKVFVGTNDARFKDERLRRTRGGMIRCLDRQTGKSVWNLVIPRFRKPNRDFNFDDMDLGVCSPPSVEGNRLYVVGSRAEVLCLDTEGMANGNDGPFQTEAEFMSDSDSPGFKTNAQDGDIIWCYDTIKELPSWPQDAASSAVLVYGDYVYVGTSNGVDNSHTHVPYPDTPSLIVLDKRTGKLVAQDKESIGHRLFHGQWSSPTLGIVNGKPQIIYGAGDAFCYAFEPIQKHDPQGKVQTLKCIWRCDCTPPAYKEHPYQCGIYRSWHSSFYGKGPSEIIGTPVFHNNHVYVTIGQDTLHGRGPGAVTCIDATGQGDVTQTHLRWQNTDIDRSLSTVAIEDGLLYVTDYTGYLHCLNAKTGKPIWKHNTESPLWSSPFIADNKIYLGTEDRELWILKAGNTAQIINKIRLPHSMYSTVIAVDNTLYFATEKAMYAVTQNSK